MGLSTFAESDNAALLRERRKTITASPMKPSSPSYVQTAEQKRLNDCPRAGCSLEEMGPVPE